LDQSCGEDRIEFRLGGRVGSASDWQEAMVRWANIGYQDGVSIA